MARSDFLYRRFLECLPYEPTFCQDGLFRKVADFLTASLCGGNVYGFGGSNALLFR